VTEPEIEEETLAYYVLKDPAIRDWLLDTDRQVLEAFVASGPQTH
jgi:hypothetical protein